MDHSRNLFSQSFKTLNELRSLTFAYFGMNCAISIIDSWFPDSVATTMLYAPFGAIFTFYFFCRLFDVTREHWSLRLFAGYAARYVIAMYAIGQVVAFFVIENFDSPTAETPEQAIIGLFLLLGVLLAILLPIYFLGTALAAQIVGKQKQIWESLRRSIRQAGYMAPRFLGCFLPLIIVQTTLLGLMPPPVTLSGETNTFGVLLMIASNAVSIVADAVLCVIFARAYLKDLRERGEIPAVDEEVFA